MARSNTHNGGRLLVWGLPPFAFTHTDIHGNRTMARIIGWIRGWFEINPLLNPWRIEASLVKGHAKVRERERRLRQLERGIIQKF